MSDTPDPGQGQAGEDRTVFQPSARPSSAAPRAVAPPASPSTQQPHQLQVGDVLNHIFEVKRFIARGGMGEVFEGINVNSDERVAIKVILPSLAADPNVQAMFRKEARTLTRLNHPSLVQYRVLAQEPQLGVFYIVTEFVDGNNLSDILSKLNPGVDELIALTRSLAEGLHAAHMLGAIHRDISPDNVMLEGGQLAGARIIDFGIAKDLDPGTATIIGDGFAGKLNYVAPEQLGDFDRQVGPWTDIYSLGLVILAISMRRDIDMGGTLVDAVDKRRRGPDLGPIPIPLRPVIAKMLEPNPATRLRSMADVIAALSGLSANARSIPVPQRASPMRPTAATEPLTRNKRRTPLIVAGGLFGLLLAVTGIYFANAVGDEKDAPVRPTAPVEPRPQPVSLVANATVAREALDAGLAGIGCTWLDIANVAEIDAGVAIALRGVAGMPAQAQAQVAHLLEAKNVKVAGINFDDVSPIQSTECGPLEAFRQLRDPVGGRLGVAQRQFEMSKLGDIGQDAGKLGATAIIDVSLTGSVPGAALFGMEESGAITPILPDRGSFDQSGIEKLGEGKYRIPLATTHKGWSGVLLLTGNGPFEPQLIGGASGSRGADWPQKFLTIARQRGWKSEMVWYKTVDQQPQ